MDRRKLSKLILEKREERGETQRDFAEYFSKLSGNKVSYGFVQTLEDPSKTSVPEWGNMKAIAKMYNVTVEELDLYLENDAIADIKDVSKVYKHLSALTPNKANFLEVARDNLSTEELFDLALAFLEQSKQQIAEAAKIKQTFNALKNNMDGGIV